jgi:hypothetical protein
VADRASAEHSTKDEQATPYTPDFIELLGQPEENMDDPMRELNAALADLQEARHDSLVAASLAAGLLRPGQHSAEDAVAMYRGPGSNSSEEVVKCGCG